MNANLDHLFIEEAYGVVVGKWNFSPREFWSLSLEEYYWLLKARAPKRMYGGETEESVADLYQQTYGEGGN